MRRRRYYIGGRIGKAIKEFDGIMALYEDVKITKWKPEKREY